MVAQRLTKLLLLFSVQACNSDQYVAVPRRDMVRLLQQRGQWQDRDRDGTYHVPETYYCSHLDFYMFQGSWRRTGTTTTAVRAQPLR